MHTCFHPDLQVGVSPLSEEEALHVVRVLRMTEGQTVRLIDGVGGEAVGTLTAVGKRKASVHVEH
ncbi:MAG TPA: 16S rRNA (uracil(1498)-N(3))-methyltransferase, partial [Flavobacteriales bacterium]|nr:16S rRNA (uracil(1498)-N(3))-methyltransferase [Flavobacteriales bacterium]